MVGTGPEEHLMRDFERMKTSLLLTCCETRVTPQTFWGLSGHQDEQGLQSEEQP